MPPKQTPVAQWLEGKFQAWRAAQTGHRAGVTQFALYIGISRDDLNNYLLKGVRPEAERLEKIGQALGWEIYDLVGLPRPDPQLRAVTEAFQRLPAAQRGVAEAVLRQPGLLELAGQLVAPAGSRKGKAARGRPSRQDLEQEWRAIIADLEDAQVLRLLAVARTLAAQESAALAPAAPAPATATASATDLKSAPDDLQPGPRTPRRGSRP
jgi:hypothetical protein